MHGATRWEYEGSYTDGFSSLLQTCTGTSAKLTEEQREESTHKYTVAQTLNFV
jgi:hypothetical protein